MNKKFKKLALNTETLRNLSDPDLKQAAGGTTIANTDCTGQCTMCTRVCTECTIGCTICIM